MASYRCIFRSFLLCFAVTFVIFVITGLHILHDESEEDNSIIQDHDYVFQERDQQEPVQVNEEILQSKVQPNLTVKHEDIPVPIIMWWYEFTHEQGRARRCGNVSCFFTNDRKYFHHPNMKVFLMYGTSFDYMDLPFPRLPHHEWALLHEESPKNVYLFSHPEIMELFNHTATFKRESDFPLPTLWLRTLEELESTEYLVPVEEKTKHLSELALVNYVHSDCGCPSDRDHFVDMMQKHIKVDSYGKCRHNKDLPENLQEALKGMDHPEFFKIVAKYKFTLAVENGVCDDYITEKLWRTLQVGSVPIIIGSPKIRDFLPDNHSAILVENFKDMKNLIDLLLHLNKSDTDYNKYLQFKRPGGVTNTYLREYMRTKEYFHNIPGKQNFVEATECFMCKRIHDNIKRKQSGLPVLKHQATVEHYGCPRPKVFKGKPPNDLERVDNDWFAQEWIHSSFEAMALKSIWNSGKLNYTKEEVYNKIKEVQKYKDRHQET